MSKLLELSGIFFFLAAEIVLLKRQLKILDPRKTGKKIYLILIPKKKNWFCLSFHERGARRSGFCIFVRKWGLALI